MDDDLYIMLDIIHSETKQDFLWTTLGCNDVQSSNIMSQILPSNSENIPPSKEANINDQITEFTFDRTSSSSIWGRISSAMVEACEKNVKGTWASGILMHTQQRKSFIKQGEWMSEL